MNNIPDEERIPSELVELSSLEERNNTSEDMVAMNIATFVMEEYRPGFVIIGSPILNNHKVTGVSYPESCAILINAQINFTKGELARVLYEMAVKLDEDMVALNAFINEAFPEENNE